MTLPDKIFEQHIAVLGKTGSGKTSTAKLIVERVVGHHDARVCILDPLKSDWWGLTLRQDGKRRALPFHILGGPYGHVPLHPAAGEAIGRIVGNGALRHSIIDMADFDDGDHTRFFVAFARSLFRHVKGVVYLIVEEAQNFAPKEFARFGDEPKAIHWMKTIATGARSKGIRLTVCSSRVQALHNAVLGSCETLIAHRLTAPADQEPVKKWLASNADKPRAEKIMASLSSLKTGEAWVCSGEAKIIQCGQLPPITTYDNSRTPTGESSTKEVRPTPINVEALTTIIGKSVEEAKANDPTELKKQLADARRQLAELQRAKPIPQPKVEVKKIEVPILKDSQLSRLEKSLKGTTAHVAALTELRDAIAGAMRQHAKAEHTPMPLPRPVPPPPRLVPQRPAAVHGEASSNGQIGSGERRILTAVAQYPAGVDRRQLTVLTGYKRRTRDTYLQRLRVAGHVGEAADGRLRATVSGLQTLGEGFERLPVGDALRAYWRQRLSIGERRILECVCAVYPAWVARDDLTEKTEYKRRTRDTYLQRLEAKKLIVVGGGTVQAAAELFGA